MIVFDKVYFAYKKNLVLNDVSLTISPGEFVVIVGPNGSGKSTLIKHINGLLQPTDGNVTVDGMKTDSLVDLKNIRKRVGYVFQNPENSLVANTVEEDVAFGPENLGLPREEIVERVYNSLRCIGIENLAQRPIKMLSGGQKQKVAIAGALALRSKYLLLDEATAMLNPVARSEIISLIEMLNKKKKVAIIMVTHDQDEIARAERVIGISKGRIIFDGTPRELFADLDLVKKMELEVPEITKLSDRLKKSGIILETPILSAEELVDKLCKLN